MGEPIFPVRSLRSEMPEGPLLLDPYRQDGTWLFDDPEVGLTREPFVGEVNGMLDRLTADILRAAQGFRLLFSATPFAGAQTSFRWMRADPVEGYWYRADETGEEGWLCPSLFWYFPSPPLTIFVRAEARHGD